MTIKLDRLSVSFSFTAKGDNPSGQFVTLWQRTVEKIEAQETRQDEIIASLQDILSGSTNAAVVTAANLWTAPQTFSVAPDAPSYMVGGVQVIGARDTGWTASTGTANKGAFAAYAGTTRSAGYVQAEAQATDNAAKAASQRLKAIEDALTAHGIIGA